MFTSQDISFFQCIVIRYLPSSSVSLSESYKVACTSRELKRDLYLRVALVDWVGRQGGLDPQWTGASLANQQSRIDTTIRGRWSINVAAPQACVFGCLWFALGYPGGDGSRFKAPDLLFRSMYNLTLALKIDTGNLFIVIKIVHWNKLKTYE